MKSQVHLQFPFQIRTRNDEGQELPTDICEVESVISNDKLDGHYSRMSDDTLYNFGIDAANGVPFLLDHSAEIRNQLGMFVAGHFDEQKKEVKAIARMLRDTEDTPDNMKVNEFIRRIEAGLYKGVSVSFRDGKEICDLCHKDVWALDGDARCPHIPGRMYNGELATYEIQGARLREVSLVATPSNKDACIIDTRSDAWTKDFKQFKLEGDNSETGQSALELEGLKYRESLIEDALKEGVRAEDDFDEAAWKERLQDYKSDHIISLTKTWKNTGDIKWGTGGRQTTDEHENPINNPNSVVLPAHLFSY